VNDIIFVQFFEMLMLIYFLVNYNNRNNDFYLKKIFFFSSQDFENDLLDIRTTFESHKDDPPLPRNAPPIAGKF